MAAAPSPRDALLVGASGVAAAIIAVLSTLAMQVAVALGAAMVAASLMMARAGRVLNPAWIIVGWFYLLGPMGSLLNQAGISVSAGALMLLAPVPFVLAAIVMQPQSLARLRLLAPVLLLALLAGLSLGWSADPTYGVEKLTLWTLVCLLQMAALVILAHGSSRISWRFVGGVAFAYALVLLLFPDPQSPYHSQATTFGANPIIEARAVYVGVLVVLFGPFPSVAKLVMAPTMILAGLSTGSDGPAVGLIVGAWAGVAESLRCAGRTNRRAVLGLAALGLLTGLGAVVLLSGALDPSLTNVASEPNNAARVTYLAVAARLFLGSPVLGTGFGGFAATGFDFYPHNLVAEVASELGLAGILILVVWLAMALLGAARSPVLVALFVGSFAFAMFSSDLSSNVEFWMFSALAVAMLPVGVNGSERLGAVSDS